MGNFAENLNLGNRFRPPPVTVTLCNIDYIYENQDLTPVSPNDPA